MGQSLGRPGCGSVSSLPTAGWIFSNYGDVSVDPAAAVRRRLGEAAEASLQSDSFRIDASDLMPPEVGGSTVDGAPGAFWRAMIDWVDGRRSIEEAFGDIDAEWVALRAQRARLDRPTRDVVAAITALEWCAPWVSNPEPAD